MFDISDRVESIGCETLIFLQNWLPKNEHYSVPSPNLNNFSTNDDYIHVSSVTDEPLSENSAL